MKRPVEGGEEHLDRGWIAEGFCPVLYTFYFSERKDHRCSFTCEGSHDSIPLVLFWVSCQKNPPWKSQKGLRKRIHCGSSPKYDDTLDLFNPSFSHHVLLHLSSYHFPIFSTPPICNYMITYETITLMLVPNILIAHIIKKKRLVSTIRS